MLDMSETALAVVRRSHTVRIRAESWLDGDLLADGIPVVDGREDRDRSATVPERITLAVPSRDRGVDWAPGADPMHPVAAYGQQLRIDYGVDVGGGRTEWINRGWFLVTSSSTDGDTVTVQAEGLLRLIDEARLVAAYEPSGTLASTVQGLVEPALTVQVDGTLVDRTVPVGMQWDQDRMGALTEVLDAWPAAARVTEDAVLLVEPVADPTVPVLELTDGQEGTVIRWQTATSRDGAFNTVVCQGETTDGVQVQGIAYDIEPGSPFRVGGHYSPMLVPYFFDSPLLRTVAQCRAAARTTLARLRRSNGRMLTATVLPHPGLQTGDAVTVTGQGLDGALCVIERLSLPYQGDAMSLTLRVVG